jgi:hypothetical protein
MVDEDKFEQNLRSMKKPILVTTLFLFCLAGIHGQWCVPPTVLPYNSNMPGITHFVLNTIDRTSLDLEDYPHNSYVNTGLSTELIAGQTYSVSITYTIDPQICPDMNLRVWIDYNKDYQLDDVGETVIIANNQLPGTYTGSFTVPANAPLQTTRLRVTAKMTPNGGHTMPTPCDNPADPFGYHGEIEDYDVNITGSTGISTPSAATTFSAFTSNGKIHFHFNSVTTSKNNLVLIDMQGKIISTILNDEPVINSGFDYDYSSSGISPGIYLAILSNENKKESIRIIVE